LMLLTDENISLAPANLNSKVKIIIYTINSFRCEENFNHPLCVNVGSINERSIKTIFQNSFSQPLSSDISTNSSNMRLVCNERSQSGDIPRNKNFICNELFLRNDCVAVCKNQMSKIICASNTFNSEYIVSVSDDQSIEVWNIRDGYKPDSRFEKKIGDKRLALQIGISKLFNNNI
jgi:hypothetical protein